MCWIILVYIVRCFINKDKMQTHIKIFIVDFSIQLRDRRTCRKVQNPRLNIQILSTRGNKLFRPFGGAFLEREKDNVGEALNQRA